MEGGFARKAGRVDEIDAELLEKYRKATLHAEKILREHTREKKLIEIDNDFGSDEEDPA